MKVLITGGAGFIGSHLAKRLVSAGHLVHIIDNMSTGRATNVERIHNCIIQEQPIEEAFSSASWLKDIDIIYHLAATVGVKLVVNEPIHTIENNVAGTSAVLRAASAFKIPTLIASTSEVYGKSEKVPFKEDDDVMYGATIYNRWSYAMSKAIDEHLALAYHAKNDLPVVITRFFNTVGPRQVGQYGMVIPRFIEAAKQGKPIVIYGDGKQSRCFCHVEDTINALVNLLLGQDRHECYGRIFNIGSNEEVTILQLAQRIIELTKSKSKITYESYDKAYGAKFDDLRRRIPDISRIKKAINWKPTHNLDSILRDLI